MLLKIKARSFVVLMIVMCFLFINTTRAQSPQNISVIIDGQMLRVDSPPVIRDNRTLVPLRAIFEALGATVDWNATTQTITGRKNSSEVVLRINDPNATVDGRNVSLDVPPVIISGRTKVPIRFIAESMGATVAWISETRTVNITVSEQPVQAPAPATIEARVTRVIDGDTIVVNLAGRTERVRLIGIDTPETVHPTRPIEPFGPEASAFVDKTLTGKTVWLEFDVQQRDRFGRLLAYVWTEKPKDTKQSTVRAKMVNALLLERGFAQISTFPPNVKYVDIFTVIQAEARNAGRGIWKKAQADPVPPSASGIVISSVDLRAEVVTIENRGSETVNISGWVLVSEVGNQRLTFLQGTTIAAGGTIRVVSGSDASAGAGRIL